MTLDEIRSQLQTGSVPRALLVAIISNGLNLPNPLRVLAYTYIQRAPQSELDKLAPLGLRAAELLIARDFDGLRQFLTENGVPAPIIGAINENLNQVK